MVALWTATTSACKSSVLFFNALYHALGVGHATLKWIEVSKGFLFDIPWDFWQRSWRQVLEGSVYSCQVQVQVIRFKSSPSAAFKEGTDVSTRTSEPLVLKGGK